MEVSGGNLPADHSARQGQKTDVEVLLDDIENAFAELDYSASSAPIEALLLETAKRMLTETYTDKVPPSLAQIINLIMDRDYEPIRRGFNKMWSELTSYHRKLVQYYFDRSDHTDPRKKKEEAQHLGGLKPRVSHNFRSIDTIVRNLPLDMRT